MTGAIRILPADTPARPIHLGTPSLPSSEPEPEPDTDAGTATDYADGYRDGEAAGRAAAVDAAREILNQLAAVLTDAETTLALIDDRAALVHDTATRATALDLAGQVLEALWATEAQARVEILATLLNELPKDRPVTLSVSADPPALKLWTEAAAAVLAEAVHGLEWRTDPTLAWPDLLARWDGGGWWGGLRASLWALAHPEEAPPL